MANPTATFETSLGSLKAELYEDKMPITVGNFAQYFRAEFLVGSILFGIVTVGMIVIGLVTDSPLLVDFATLTGAARTALGPELPAAFSTDAELLREAHGLGEEEADPIWPMPLWAGYDDDLGSKVADVSNVASHAFAGAIIGGLFLQRFVPRTRQWLHLDLHAWNTRERPGRPVGAEAQCARLIYRLVRSRFG